MLQKQKQEMMDRQHQRQELNKLMDKRMIELDKERHEKEKRKAQDRDLQARKQRADMLEQELQLKQLASYKKVQFTLIYFHHLFKILTLFVLNYITE